MTLLINDIGEQLITIFAISVTAVPCKSFRETQAETIFIGSLILILLLGLKSSSDQIRGSRHKDRGHTLCKLPHAVVTAGLQIWPSNTIIQHLRQAYGIVK